MYRDLTINQVMDKQDDLREKYEEGLINDIDYVIQTKNLCLCFINQERDIAERTLDILNEVN